MNWQNTNVIRPQEALAQDLVTGRTQFFQDGVPVEAMLSVLQPGQDAWFCIPINADGDYVRAFLRILSQNPGRRYFIELSNEVWNGMFPQSRYFNSNWNANMEEFSARTGDLAVLVRSILPDTGLSVLGAPSWGEGWWITRSAEIIRSLGLPMPDFTAIAPYFGDSLQDDPATFGSGAMAAAVDESLQRAISCADAARAQGMKLAIYECGNHTTAGGGVQVNRHPAMEQLYHRYHRDLLQIADGPVCTYALASSYGQHGSWGLIEHEDTQDTPKMRGVLPFLK
jgi:hypothetical protein